MDIVEKKIDDSIKIIDLFKDYLYYFTVVFKKLKYDTVENFKNKLEREYPDTKKKLLERIKAIKSESFNLLNLDNKSKLIFQSYALIVRFDNILDFINNIINSFSANSSIFVDSDLTSSYKNEVINKEMEIGKQYINYIKIKRNNSNEFVLNKFYTIIWKQLKEIESEKIIIQVKNINDLFRKYPETIELYYHIIQNILENYSYSDDTYLKQLVFYIINMVEDDKSHILQESLQFVELDKSKKKILNIQRGSKNIFLRTFGLVPSNEFLPLDKLFSNKLSENKIRNNKHSDEILEKISKKKIF